MPGHPTGRGDVSGDRVQLVGDALAAVVHGLGSVHRTQASPPVVIGGLAVLCRLSTPYGRVKVDVLEVRDVDLDPPADDVGDRLHATSHAWAHDTAGPITIEVDRPGEPAVEARTMMADPGPLVAM